MFHLNSPRLVFGNEPIVILLLLFPQMSCPNVYCILQYNFSFYAGLVEEEIDFDEGMTILSY